jgi:hypothetical protein
MFVTHLAATARNKKRFNCSTWYQLNALLWTNVNLRFLHTCMPCYWNAPRKSSIHVFMCTTALVATSLLWWRQHPPQLLTTSHVQCSVSRTI